MFWREVSTSTVRALQEDWAYGPDFLLFQYSATQYFREIRKKCQEEKEEEGHGTHSEGSKKEEEVEEEDLEEE